MWNGPRTEQEIIEFFIQAIADKYHGQDRWTAFFNCICNRDLPADRMYEYFTFNESTGCNQSMVDLLRNLYCAIYWKTIERFSQAAFNQGWLQRVETFHQTGSERFYCRMPRCELCNTAPVTDPRYWGSKPLPLCSSLPRVPPSHDMTEQRPRNDFRAGPNADGRSEGEALGVDGVRQSILNYQEYFFRRGGGFTI